MVLLLRGKYSIRSDVSHQSLPTAGLESVEWVSESLEI